MDYQEQVKKNEEAFNELLKVARPEIHLLMQTIDETGINPFVVWKVIVAMHNIAQDTKYGNVVVEIEDNTVRFVRGQHANKVNEPLIKRRDLNQT